MNRDDLQSRRQTGPRLTLEAKNRRSTLQWVYNRGHPGGQMEVPA